jgi:chaperonin GroES
MKMSDFPLNIDPVPLHGHVLVRMLGNSKSSSGGIIIPDTVVNRPIQGVVEEVSQGEFVWDGQWVTHQVHIGDSVIFNWKSGFDLVLEDGDRTVEYRIIHEKEIIAILKGVNYGE